MTAKDPGNFQKQYNSRISWDFQLQPCTKPELKSVGHSKNNTDEHCPKFACVVHSQTTIPLYLCQAVDKNIFAVQRQLPLITKGCRNTGAVRPRWQVWRRKFRSCSSEFPARDFDRRNFA